MPTAGNNKKSFEENLSDEDSLSSIKENPNDPPDNLADSKPVSVTPGKKKIDYKEQVSLLALQKKLATSKKKAPAP